MYQIKLYYGYEENECGIYHSFRAEDPDVKVDSDEIARDLAEQLKDCILGDELLLPRTMLRSEGDLFLCDMTPKELSEQLGVPIRFVSNDGADFLDAVLGCGGELLSE